LNGNPRPQNEPLMNIVEIEHLKKSFGAIQAVKDISFGIREGEIFGLLGPNGAGKSTTIKILATLLKAGGGSVRINGFDVNRESRKVRNSIGIIFQDPSLDERLTAWENLYFHSKFYHVPEAEIEERIRRALDLVELTDRKDHLVGNFSGGMKRRLEIARGIIHIPTVLFLDEPTIGLDPQTRTYIWRYLLDLRNNRKLTMLLTTHYMEEAEICDRIAIIDHGEIIALDTPDNLKRILKHDIVTISAKDNEEMAGQLKRDYAIDSRAEDNSLTFPVENGETFVPRLFNKYAGQITSVLIKKPTLEDVFIRLTGRRIREEEASSTDKLRGAVKRRGRR
jgi:ABC-2 type transport system ATP-binding protein